MRNIINRIKQWFNSYKERKECRKNHQRITKDNKISLLSNAPKEDSTRYAQDVYLLHEKVMDPDVYNIGIIGSFGSGKSSFLKTYQNQFWHSSSVFSSYKSKYYSTVSLANFECLDEPQKIEVKNSNELGNNSTSKDGSEGPASETNNNQIHDINFSLERSILEQLLFKVSKSTVPSSRISRIKQNFWPSFFLALFVVITVASTLMGLMDIFNIYKFFEEINFRVYFAVATAGLFLSLLLILYNSRINKVSVNSLEIELAKQSQESVLNLFIDEIIYYFKRTKTKVVVFEDIERFKEIGIFSKLRELNTLINNSQQIRQKVTFIYAINEDILKKKEDRAKFFDFILTISPIVDASNAPEKIKSLIGGENGLEKAIDDFSTYLTDIRIINNTINDYNLLKARFSTFKKKDDSLNKELMYEKIFAIAAYKNICPHDYNQFRYNDGILYRFLVYDRKRIVDSIIEKNNNEVASIDNSLNSLNERLIHNFEYAKMLITGYLIDKGALTNNPSIESTHKNIQNITAFDNSLGSLFVYSHSVRDYYGRDIKYYKTASKESILAFFNVKTWEDFNNNFVDLNTEREELINRKSKLSEEISNIKKERISTLVKKYDKDFNFGSEVEGKFIKFLLVNSYIDETYPIYFQNSSGSFLSENDQLFVDNVISSITSDYDIELSNCYAVVKRIQEERFLDKYVLNFSLINYLFDNFEDYENKCKNILSYLASYSSEATEFITNYFNLGSFNQRFLYEMTKYSSSFISKLLSNKGISEQAKEQCMVVVLEKYHDFKELFSNSSTPIKQFLEEKNRIGTVLKTINRSNIKDVIDYVRDSNIKIKNINSIVAIDNEILTSVIHNSSYEINLVNLRYLVDEYYSYGCILNISNIRKINNETINNYVSNLEALLKTFINECKDKFEEDSAVVEEIISNKDIDDDIKIRYFNLLTNRIDFRETITENLCKLLLVNNRLFASWENVKLLLKKYSNLKQDLKEYLTNDSNSEIWQTECELDIVLQFSDNFMIVKNALESCDSVLEKVEELNLSVEMFSNLLKYFNPNKDGDNQTHNEIVFGNLVSKYDGMIPELDNALIDAVAEYLIKHDIYLKDELVNAIVDRIGKQKIDFSSKYLKQLNDVSFVWYVKKVLGEDCFDKSRISIDEYKSNRAIYDEIQKRGKKTIEIKKRYCYLK